MPRRSSVRIRLGATRRVGLLRGFGSPSRSLVETWSLILLVCPIVPLRARCRKRPPLRPVEDTHFVWKRAEEKFTKSKRGQRKRAPTAESFPGNHRKATRLLATFGGIQSGHLRRKFSFGSFRNTRILIIEESLILARDER